MLSPLLSWLNVFCFGTFFWSKTIWLRGGGRLLFLSMVHGTPRCSTRTLRPCDLKTVINRLPGPYVQLWRHFPVSKYHRIDRTFSSTLNSQPHSIVSTHPLLISARSAACTGSSERRRASPGLSWKPFRQGTTFLPVVIGSAVGSAPCSTHGTSISSPGV